jgi:hypothetical protein
LVACSSSKSSGGGESGDPVISADVVNKEILIGSLDAGKLKTALNKSLEDSNFAISNVSKDGDVLTFGVLVEAGNGNKDKINFTFKSNDFKKAEDGSSYVKNATKEENLFYACEDAQGNGECGTGKTQAEADADLDGTVVARGTFTRYYTGTLVFSGSALTTPLQYSNFGYIKNEETENINGALSDQSGTWINNSTAFAYGDSSKAKDFANNTSFTGKAVALAEYESDDSYDSKQFSGDAVLSIAGDAKKKLELDLVGFGKIVYNDGTEGQTAKFEQDKAVAGKYYVDSYSGDSYVSFNATGYGATAPEEAVGKFEYGKGNKDSSISIEGSFGAVKK